MAPPLISISILNYRRREALLETLEAVRSQTYNPREIIVIDNNSGDGTAEFLRQNFPDIRVLALTTNEGAVARNHGVQAARGEIVVTLDNDEYFASPFELHKVAEEFQSCPQASCIVFKALAGNRSDVFVRDWCHPYSYSEYADTPFDTNYIPEGACAFRRRAFLAAGGYWEPLWIGHEGWDLALHLLDNGGRILYRPRITVRHMHSPQARPSSRPFYFYTRNYIWIAARNYNPVHALGYLGEKLAMMAWFSARSRHLPAFVRGLRDGITGLPAAWKARTPLSKTTWKTLKDMDRHRPGIVFRLRRHRERVLI